MGIRTAMAAIAAAVSWHQAAAGQAMPAPPAPLAGAPAERAAADASLARSAGSARIGLAVSVDRFLSDLDPRSRRAARGAFALGGHEFAPWPLLIRGALQVRRQSGPTGETLWFNPVFDAGLVLRWRFEPGGWRVTQAWWVLGTDIRQDAAAAMPRFVLPIGDVDPATTGQPVPTASDADLRYVFDHAPFALAAAPDWAPPAAAADRTREVARRAWGAVTAIRAFDAATGAGAGRTRALTYLMDAAVDPAATMTPATLTTLRSLGRPIRAGMLPVSAYRRADGRWRLMMQSTDAPGITIALAFDVAAARIGDVEVFDAGISTGAAPAEVRR